MALTDCLDCGAKISTVAKACPHCGRPKDLESVGRCFHPLRHRSDRSAYLH